ncbi:MAG: DUF3943 domain-containing protein [Flavisolibacter sp.]
MKKIIGFVLVLCSFEVQAQADSILIPEKNLRIIEDSIPPKMDSVSAVKYGFHGNLVNDDPVYNPKAPGWLVSARVLSSNVFNWALNRYYFKQDWTSSGISDWKRNFQRSPEWDDDNFGINFLGHPHTGSFYFNVARSNGFNFWQSLPYTFQGSFVWEWLGENERPSFNDLINTPLSGVFLGEVFYRISSSLMNDRSRGAERIARESMAAIMNPTRTFNRFTSGKLGRVVPHEVYQKEPLHVNTSGGIHIVNAGQDRFNNYDDRQTNSIMQMQIDYGDPFETRSRKPFDVFRFQVELSIGDDEKLIDNVMGFGLLHGRTVRGRKLKGFFQHYDYWRYNEVFELSSMGFGLGMMHKIPVGKKVNFLTNLHAAIVPLAGNNNPFLPDITEKKAYNFGGGLQSKLEGFLELDRHAIIGIKTYQYFITNYTGEPGNSLVGIIKPSVVVRLIDQLHLGFEHHIYHNDRYRPGVSEKFRIVRTEQKFFLQWRLREY